MPCRGKKNEKELLLQYSAVCRPIYFVIIIYSHRKPRAYSQYAPHHRYVHNKYACDALPLRQPFREIDADCTLTFLLARTESDGIAARVLLRPITRDGRSIFLYIFSSTDQYYIQPIAGRQRSSSTTRLCHIPTCRMIICIPIAVFAPPHNCRTKYCSPCLQSMHLLRFRRHFFSDIFRQQFFS